MPITDREKVKEKVVKIMKHFPSVDTWVQRAQRDGETEDLNAKRNLRWSVVCPQVPKKNNKRGRRSDLLKGSVCAEIEISATFSTSPSRMIYWLSFSTIFLVNLRTPAGSSSLSVLGNCLQSKKLKLILGRWLRDAAGLQTGFHVKLLRIGGRPFNILLLLLLIHFAEALQRNSSLDTLPVV